MGRYITAHDQRITDEELNTTLTKFFRQQIDRHGFEAGLRGGGQVLETAKHRAIEVAHTKHGEK